MGKNCALGLEYGPRPSPLGRTQDLGYSFFPIQTSRPVNNIYLLTLQYVHNFQYRYTVLTMQYSTYNSILIASNIQLLRLLTIRATYTTNFIYNTASKHQVNKIILKL